ncbi:MAG TPA: peptide chain release factor N(5)-glutamine methyltransferase [Aquiluna sp.]
MTNLRSFLEQTATRFKAAGIESFQADAEQLIAFSLGISRGELVAKAFLNSEFTAEPSLIALIDRRANREPLQHLTGVAFFRQLTLSVGEGVFIPRPETEAVVAVALEFLESNPNSKVLDIGTGSGAIAISIATEAGIEVDAIEKSEPAAKFAKGNIDSNQARVNLMIGDFRDLELGFGEYDLVISNPPYIPISAVPIDPEVRDHDPDLALYGGEDGLDLIREIEELSQLLVRTGGMLVLEHADGQSDSVCELLLANWQNVKAHPDPTGRLRFVSAIR